MRHLRLSFYQKYATRISVCVIAVSKSQEFLLKVRRLSLFFSTTTQWIRLRRRFGVFLTTSDTIATSVPHRHSPRVGIAFRRVCLSVCLHVCALTGKRLELLTPNLIHVYSIAVARHALTQRSRGQRSRSHCCENRHGRTVVSDHDRYSVHRRCATCGRCRRGTACR